MQATSRKEEKLKQKSNICISREQTLYSGPILRHSRACALPLPGLEQPCSRLLRVYCLFSWAYQLCPSCPSSKLESSYLPLTACDHSF